MTDFSDHLNTALDERATVLPQLGSVIPAAHGDEGFFNFLAHRRSTMADLMSDEAPDDETLAAMLTLAARVPDHRRVNPYRFLVFQGEGRARAGTIFEDVFVKANPKATAQQRDYERRRFLRAGIVIGVIAAIDHEHKTPDWEQILTVGAVCQNLLLAASAKGFASQWLTEWYAFDGEVSRRLGLAENEQIAGYIYIGGATSDPKERPRPDLRSLVKVF